MQRYNNHFTFINAKGSKPKKGKNTVYLKYMGPNHASTSNLLVVLACLAVKNLK